MAKSNETAPLRPIDAASRPGEVLTHVLTMPIEDADAIRSVLWDFKAEVLAELRGQTRIELLERLQFMDFLIGPYGLLGPYGVVGILAALTVGYFTLNGALFLLTFLATYGFLMVGMLRTTPRWTVDRVMEVAARPANAALLLAWAKTQGLELDCAQPLAEGIRDSTDYFTDLVVVALEDDPKLAKKVCRQLLSQTPEAFPWAWRFAPSRDLFKTLEKTELDESHLVGLVGLIAALEIPLRASHNRVIADAFSMVYAPDEVEEPAVALPLPLDEVVLHQRPNPDADLDRLAQTDHPIALHVLDGWRRTWDVNDIWRADRLLRSAIQRQTGIHIKKSVAVETTLDSLLFPMLDDPTFRTTVREGLFERRERDMNTQRRVEPDIFESFFCHEVHTHILWGAYIGHKLRGTFRIDETFKLVDAKDKPFVWEPSNMVGIVHPKELSAETRQRWQLVFADYDLHGFDQLSRPFYDAPAENIAYFDGQPDLEVLGRLGWSGRKEDDEFRLERIFHWNGTTEKGVIEITPEGTSLAFWTMEGPMSVRLKRPLSELHPIVISEAIYAVKSAMD